MSEEEASDLSNTVKKQRNQYSINTYNKINSMKPFIELQKAKLKVLHRSSSFQQLL